VIEGRLPGRARRALDRARAWLVTGPLGRGLAFALDFGAALRTMLARRRAARRADTARARD
jgi:hypothetical protein